MSDNKEKRPPWWMWAIGGLMLLLFAAWAGVRGFLEYQLWDMRRGLTPSFLAQTRRLMDEPVEIPLAWREVQPWDAEFVDACNRWVEENEKFTAAIDPKGTKLQLGSILDALETGAALSDADKENIEKLVAEMGPVQAAAQAAIRLPSYDLDGVRDRRAGFEVPHQTNPEYIMLRENARAFAIKAYGHSQRGEHAEALDATLDILGMARRHRASSLVNQMISVAIQKIALLALHRQMESWTQPALAERALEKLNRLAPEFRMDAFARDNLAILNATAILREHRRHSYLVDMESKRPGVRVLWEGMEAIMEYPDWRSAQLPGNSPERMALQDKRMINAIPVVSSPWTNTANALGFRKSLEEMLLCITMPDTDSAREAILLREAQLDLMRLKLALRLRELRGEGAPDAPLSADEMTRWSVKGLRDPFADPPAPFQWSETRKLYYSVGADGKDDGAVAGSVKGTAPGDDLFWE